MRAVTIREYGGTPTVAQIPTPEPGARQILIRLRAAGMNPHAGSGNPHHLRRDFMARTIETLLRENLHGVFGEHDIQKRQSNIARLWAEDGVFIDHNARYEGHSKIDQAASKLGEKFPNFVFTERGELQALNGVGRLDWGFGPAGEEAVITGIDVLVLKGDKIGAVYTFLNQRRT